MTHISIIIPVYNQALDLRKCLDSIVRVKSNQYEIIVVDDSSSEDISNIASEYNLTYIRLDGGPRGPAFARNIGAQRAQKDYLLFIDSDVVICDSWYQIAQGEITQHSEFCVIQGQYKKDRINLFTDCQI